jgi:hypothetical protein
MSSIIGSNFDSTFEAGLASFCHLVEKTVLAKKGLSWQKYLLLANTGKMLFLRKN